MVGQKQQYFRRCFHFRLVWEICVLLYAPNSTIKMLKRSTSNMNQVVRLRTKASENGHPRFD